jgi:hypothetical protein
MKIEFAIPAKYVADIAAGQTVEISVDSSGNAGTYSGIVEAVDSVVDQRSHSVLLKASVANKDDRLKHGMFANIRLVTGEKDDVILVDEDALDRIGSTEVVWVVDKKGMAHLKQVITGARDINGVEILAGLKDGDWVVTSGQLKLTEGVVVNILNKEPEPTEESTEENKEDDADKPASEEESQSAEESGQEGQDDSPNGRDDDNGKVDDAQADPGEKEDKPDNEKDADKDDKKDDKSKEDGTGNTDKDTDKSADKDNVKGSEGVDKKANEDNGKSDSGWNIGEIIGTEKSTIGKWFESLKGGSSPEVDTKQEEPSPKADEKQTGSEKA